MVALLLFQHAFSKFFGFPARMPTPAPFSLIWFAGMIELIAGALLLLGLFTRIAAFILSGEMAFAHFIGHAPKGFYPLTNGGESAVLFCFIFLLSRRSRRRRLEPRCAERQGVASPPDKPEHERDQHQAESHGKQQKNGG